MNSQHPVWGAVQAGGGLVGRDEEEGVKLKMSAAATPSTSPQGPPDPCNLANS